MYLFLNTYLIYTKIAYKNQKAEKSVKKVNFEQYY